MLTAPVTRMAIRLIARTVTTVLVVTVLALAGWFLYSALTGATLITFRTGSMSPTMPQGAIAVSLPVAAEEIEVGDVVTVRRADDALPITHRVVEVRTPDAATTPGIPEDARELVLKGDDNDTVDLEPYIVKDARRVLFAVPGVGSVLMLTQSPLGMGTLTVLAGCLATWAFWPRRRADEDPADDAQAEAEPGVENLLAADPTDDLAEASEVAAPLTRRERREAGIRS